MQTRTLFGVIVAVLLLGVAGAGMAGSLANPCGGTNYNAPMCVSGGYGPDSTFSPVYGATTSGGGLGHGYPTSALETRGSVVVTMADNGGYVNMFIGDFLTLNLGERHWVIRVEDPNTLAPFNVPPPNGDGPYVALRRGSTTLRAVTDYPCRHFVTPCLTPDLNFRVTVYIYGRDRHIPAPPTPPTNPSWFSSPYYQP